MPRTARPTIDHARAGIPFDGDSRHYRNPEQALWAAVLYTAFEDLRKRDFAFFRDNSSHFKFVCEAAGFDPEFIRDRAFRIISGKHEFINRYRMNLKSGRGK